VRSTYCENRVIVVIKVLQCEALCCGDADVDGIGLYNVGYIGDIHRVIRSLGKHEFSPTKYGNIIN